MPRTIEGHKIRFTVNPEVFARRLRGNVEDAPSVEKKKDAPLVVMKFGGTSVGSAKMIDVTTGIVAREVQSKDVVVVVSALSGITNSLEILGSDESLIGERERELRAILDRHTTTSSELPVSPEIRHQTEDVLVELFTQLNSDVHNMSLIGKERRDRILSFGERLSSNLVVGMLRQKGIKSLAVDSGSVISTDRNFGEAVPDIDKTAENADTYLRPLLKNNITPVVTGFLGSTLDGSPTTLGRGGSDYSASLLGRALKAQEVWIWTDVDGIYTADPKSDPNATLIREISIDEADRMAKGGAKVLQSKTLEPLFGTGIELRVLNTFNVSNEGTRVIHPK